MLLTYVLHKIFNDRIYMQSKIVGGKDQESGFFFIFVYFSNNFF